MMHSIELRVISSRTFAMESAPGNKIELTMQLEFMPDQPYSDQLAAMEKQLLALAMSARNQFDSYIKSSGYPEGQVHANHD